MEANKLSVLLVEPGKTPKMIKIDDSLEAMQALVRGPIEVFSPFNDDVVIICNEEGKISGLPLNRAIYADPEPILPKTALTPHTVNLPARMWSVQTTRRFCPAWAVTLFLARLLMELICMYVWTYIWPTNVAKKMDGKSKDAI